MESIRTYKEGIAVSGGLDPALFGGGARAVKGHGLGVGRFGGSEVFWGRGGFVSVAGQELSGERVLNVDCVSGPDLIAEVVDQFEHGEGGFGVPVVGDLEPDRLQAGAGCHELGAFR